MSHPYAFTFLDPSINLQRLQPVYDTLVSPEYWRGPVVSERYVRKLLHGSSHSAEEYRLRARVDDEKSSEIGRLFFAAVQDGYTSRKIAEGETIPIPDPESTSFVRIVTDSRERYDKSSPTSVGRRSIGERDERTIGDQVKVDYSEFLGNLMLQKILYTETSAHFTPDQEMTVLDKLLLKGLPLFQRRVMYARATPDGAYLTGIQSNSIKGNILDIHPLLTTLLPTAVNQLYSESTPRKHLAKAIAVEVITPSYVPAHS